MQVKRFITAGALVLLAALASPAALAQNCAGFTDVSSGSSFCPNVEWLKNRSITLGCTSATLYCPNDAVSRIAMAAFMNRLGTALTPTFIRKRDNALGALNLTGAQNVCPTDAFTVTGFPRTAVVNGLVNAFTANGYMDLRTKVVFSTDGGTIWQDVPTNDSLTFGALYSNPTEPDDISLRPYTFIDLAVGPNYRFALQVQRVSGTGTIANIYCENLVQIFNRNGTVSPLDTADYGTPGRGD